jgi:hypothetical protein
MKNTLIALLLFFSITSSFALTNANDSLPKNYLGLNLGGAYFTSKDNGDKQSAIDINSAPFYGRRVKNFIFALGLGINYKAQKIPLSTSGGLESYYGTDKSIELALLPTIRYYTKKNLFITSSFNIGRGSGERKTPVSDGRKVYYSNTDYSSKFIGGNLGIGYAIKAGKYFLIEPQISFQKLFNEVTYNYYASVNSIYFSNFEFTNNPNNSHIIFALGITYRFK